MVLLETSRVIRLHTSAAGDVYVGDDAIHGDNTQLDPFSFVHEYSNYLRSGTAIRLLGTANNAKLIVALCDTLRNSVPVQLGSPALVSSDCAPLCVLSWLWQIASTGRQYGDWHVMSSRDYATYSLVVAAQSDTKMAQELIVHHPAWPALALFGPASLPAACRLVADIIDPRWYTHKRRPGRLNRIYASLGLTPQNFKAYLNEAPVGYRYGAAINSMNVWRTQGKSLPRMFNDLVKKEQDPARLLLAITKRVVKTVVIVWQYALGTVPRDVFDPLRLVGNEEDGERLLRLFSA